MKNPLFADKKVRQAISYAINKDEIITGVLLNLGKPANGPYKPGTWAYNDHVKNTITIRKKPASYCAKPAGQKQIMREFWKKRKTVCF